MIEMVPCFADSPLSYPTAFFSHRFRLASEKIHERCFFFLEGGEGEWRTLVDFCSTLWIYVEIQKDAALFLHVYQSDSKTLFIFLFVYLCTSIYIHVQNSSNRA